MAAALLLGAALFIPVWIRVRLILDEGRLDLRLMPWGLSLGGGKLMSWLGRGVERLLDRFLTPKTRPDAAEPSKKPPKKRSRPLPWKFIVWMGGRALVLIGFLTRRLTMRVAGLDPALMGFCQGTLTGILMAWGVRRVRWESDFRPASPYAELTWDVGSSVAGLFFWVGKSVMNMPSRKAEGEPDPTGVF